MAIPRRFLIGATAFAGALLLLPPPAVAVPDPGAAAPAPVRRGGEELARPAPLAAGAEPGAAPRDAAAALRALGGYPRRTVLGAPPVNPADTSVKLGLAPYHSLAPRLNALQRLGDRVSVEVAGRSAGGRELYLVTVTAPESARQAREQERMRELIESAPAAAARDPRVTSAYKTPVFLNNNIHGNEWEGTDAALKLIEELATARDARTARLLRTTRLYINVTANPDGRVAGTRANAAGFDLNRDFITGSQPETRAVRRIAIDKQPAVMLDLHGYVNGTLIEPTTPPHGENYEYDLFLKHSYANALGMEERVNGLGWTPARDGVEPAVIPFRDQQEGWDDWPPVFTPQYMPFHGAVAAHTVEFPLAVNNSAYTSLPVAELRRRAAINTGISGAAMRAALDYAYAHRTSLIADQIEVFRRGAAGEAQRPVSERTVPGVPGIGPEDVYTTTFPRAYVIPVGKGQRSAVAAARLVDHLLANDVRVGRAQRDFRAAGRVHPAGSYVVDMRQPKRGLAQAMLAEGRDISADVSAMYDISGWSLGLLWGATVDTVRDAAPRVPVRPVRAARATGYVAASGDLRLSLTDPGEVAALNALLAQGVRVRRAQDGSAVVPGAARGAARVLADRLGVRFEAARERGGEPLRRTRVAAALTAGERFALREMGFEVLPVSTATLNAGFDWSRVDVLYVSAGLDHAALTPAARAAFHASGVGVVGVGSGGAAFSAAAGLLAATAVEGNGDANGVVRVAAALTAGERFALREMGFEVLPVSTATLNAGFDWSRVDVLYVSAGLDHAALTPAARAAFHASGVGVVGVGSGGAAFSAAAGLLAATAVEGNGDANGVVRVAGARGDALTAGAPAHAFVYAPVWFTALGEGVRVHQSYASGRLLVAGHWRADGDGTGGPADAAGRASVVGGPGVVLFGTQPLFRAHPKRLAAQVGRALLTTRQTTRQGASSTAGPE